MKRLIVDLDHTICTPDADSDQDTDLSRKYRDARPVHELIEQLRKYRKLGFEIVVHTSRNMRTYGGDLRKIQELTLPIVLDWLARHDVPYDEVIVGKPWCGFDGFYVDDRAIRPSEFKSLSYEDILDLIDRERLPG